MAKPEPPGAALNQSMTPDKPDRSLKRQRSFAEEDGAFRVRRLCILAYVSLKLMDGTFTLFLKLLTMRNHTEHKLMKALLAELGVLKLAHFFLTVAVPRILVHPRALVGILLTTGAVFIFCIGGFLLRDVYGLPLIPLWLRLAMYTQVALSVAVDATADALSRSMGLFLQPARQLGSIAVITALLIQLTVPASWQLAPLVIISVSGVICVATAAKEALKMASVSAGSRATSAVANAGRLPLFFVVMFIGAVVVGDSGEELNDQITKIEMDNDLAGGQAQSTIVKTVVTLLASTVSASVFIAAYQRRFQAPLNEDSQKAAVSRECKVAVVTIMAWGLFQGFRFAAVRAGALGQSWWVGVLVVVDKLTGTGAKDAFGLLQSLILREMATVTGTFAIPITPHMAGSIAEVFDTLGKTYITTSLMNEQSWISEHASLSIGVLSFVAVFAHTIMATVLVRSADDKLKHD